MKHVQKRSLWILTYLPTAGHSSSKLIELSPKGSFINQSSGRSKRSTISKYNEEEISDLDTDQIDDSPVDPKLVDIFDAVR